MEDSRDSAKCDWFDELDLDPTAHPVSMGTRSLGARPWLIRDRDFDQQRGEKIHSLATRFDKVAHISDESRPPSQATVDLIAAHGFETPTAAVSELPEHQLINAALAIQEDLVLMRRDDAGWHFDSGVVCFPTYWNFPAKIGRELGVVHDPVTGYQQRIADKMNRLFDRIGERPVWRRNYNLTDNRVMFQPEARADDPNVPAGQVLTGLYFRSERQTLRAVGEGWLLFTIKVQVEPIGDLAQTEEQRARLRTWAQKLPKDIAPKRHLGEPQRANLLQALTAS